MFLSEQVAGGRWGVLYIGQSLTSLNISMFWRVLVWRGSDDGVGSLYGVVQFIMGKFYMEPTKQDDRQTQVKILPFLQFHWQTVIINKNITSYVVKLVR